jgi:hypothetical protein
VELLKDSRGKLPKESPGFEVLYLALAIIPVLIFRRFQENSVNEKVIKL